MDAATRTTVTVAGISRRTKRANMRKMMMDDWPKITYISFLLGWKAGS